MPQLTKFERSRARPAARLEESFRNIECFFKNFQKKDPDELSWKDDDDDSASDDFGADDDAADEEF